MTFAWERLIWHRYSRLQIDLPTHGPSLATLIKLIAKNRVFIDDLDMKSLAATVAFEPGVQTHKPAVVSIDLRTRNREQEERLLQTLASFGYVYRRSESDGAQTRRKP